MSSIAFEFDSQKAIEVILYIANRRNAPTIRDILKLIYLADKTSLENYGRFVTGDRYVAMEQGPVASNTYDILKEARDSNAFGFLVEYRYHLRPLRDADTDELSESDIICLDQIMQAFGHFPSWKLLEEAHDDTWKEIWGAAKARGVPIPVKEIIQLFEGSSELLDYLENINNE
ncbi:hypothetical protein MNBD_CHLOROFLEXI01-1407 [hydrothermal vent metagenome]|uniref:Antitoxin SocA-like Panacea domain-containing protein n=1 Tax=hydrothermal vent metagenome TaxID=652676 RepID=A0A3B0VNR4_9ZZZZ